MIFKGWKRRKLWAIRGVTWSSVNGTPTFIRVIGDEWAGAKRFDMIHTAGLLGSYKRHR